MIATVHPIAAKTAPGAAAPAATSLLGLDFAALLAPAGDGEKIAEPRQELAGDGKDLPDQTSADDAWLAMLGATVAVPPSAVAPAVPAVTAGPRATMPIRPAVTPVIAPVSPLPDTLVLDPAAPAVEIPTPILLPAPVGTAPQPPVFTRTPVRSERGTQATGALAAEISTARDARPPSPPIAAVATPAAQVVAVMAERPAPLLQGLVAALRTPAAPPRGTEREQAGEIRPDGSLQLPLVAAAIESHKTMLDLRQEHWPQRMVEHIETLRDAADANDTRMRLVPDALGTVDVKLRRDGDTVHVAFAAERAETRALLDQAQPKLAELGESRGLRFAQSGADPGGQAQRQPAAPRLPTAPPRTTDQPPADDAGDTRIA